jgi:hypothetical protein
LEGIGLNTVCHCTYSSSGTLDVLEFIAYSTYSVCKHCVYSIRTQLADERRDFSPRILAETTSYPLYLHIQGNRPLPLAPTNTHFLCFSHITNVSFSLSFYTFTSLSHTLPFRSVSFYILFSLALSFHHYFSIKL